MAKSEPQVEVAEVEEPAAEPAAETTSSEAIDAQLAKLNAQTIPMQHVDGNGSCDAYKSDKLGNILVPLTDVAHMIEHGFEVVLEKIKQL